jgi:hypothetical protein
MKLIIDRKKWLRGTGDGSLRNRKGEMCCLGFLANTCGINQGITGIGMPSDIRNTKIKAKKNEDEWLAMFDLNIYDGFKADSRLASRLAEINDSRITSDAIKEAKIKKEFKKIGVEVTFKN